MTQGRIESLYNRNCLLYEPLLYCYCFQGYSFSTMPAHSRVSRLPDYRLTFRAGIVDRVCSLRTLRSSLTLGTEFRTDSLVQNCTVGLLFQNASSMQTAKTPQLCSSQSFLVSTILFYHMPLYYLVQLMSSHACPDTSSFRRSESKRRHGPGWA